MDAGTAAKNGRSRFLQLIKNAGCIAVASSQETHVTPTSPLVHLRTSRTSATDGRVLQWPQLCYICAARVHMAATHCALGTGMASGTTVKVGLGMRSHQTPPQAVDGRLHTRRTTAHGVFVQQ
jgi:hypothetical protein